MVLGWGSISSWVFGSRFDLGSRFGLWSGSRLGLRKGLELDLEVGCHVGFWGRVLSRGCVSGRG